MFNNKRLVEIMDEKGLNLADFSKLSGIAYSTLRDLYTGKNKNPLASTLSKMAKCLDVSSDYFVEEKVLSHNIQVITLGENIRREH